MAKRNQDAAGRPVLGVQAWKAAVLADYAARPREVYATRNPYLFEALILADRRLSPLVYQAVGWSRTGLQRLPKGCDKLALVSIARNLLTRFLLDRPDHQSWYEGQLVAAGGELVRWPNLELRAVNAMCGFFHGASDDDILAALRAAGLSSRTATERIPIKRQLAWANYKVGLLRWRERQCPPARRLKVAA